MIWTDMIWCDVIWNDVLFCRLKALKNQIRIFSNITFFNRLLTCICCLPAFVLFSSLLFCMWFSCPVFLWFLLQKPYQIYQCFIGGYYLFYKFASLFDIIIILFYCNSLSNDYYSHTHENDMFFIYIWAYAQPKKVT